MKTLKILFLSLVVLSPFASQAQAGSLSGSEQMRLRQTLENCLVRPYGIRPDGTRVLGAYRSRCQNVVRDGEGAWIRVESDYAETTLGLAEEWLVHLVPSEHSDGGDFWDVGIRDSVTGRMVEVEGVLAFGDPLEALSLVTGAAPRATIREPALDE